MAAGQMRPPMHNALVLCNLRECQNKAKQHLILLCSGRNAHIRARLGLELLRLVPMGVDHGDGGTSPPEFGLGDCPLPQILLCCKILSTRLLALQCRKMCFLLLQQDFYSKSCHASPLPRIPVRCTPMPIPDKIHKAYTYLNNHLVCD